MCEENFPTTFRDPQRLPKRRREIYHAHCAKSLKQEIGVFFFCFDVGIYCDVM